ncbi:MAG TPA: SPOR domain-containing protein [Burkholderiales bacterium]|nr:SPOR domain-containing protein [Burkholderiales bacterium]
MSKDYKGNERRRGRGRASGSGSSLLAGILIGLVLGLGIALGVAWYINKMPSPFSTRGQSSKADAPKAPPAQTPRVDDKAAKPDDAKPRFDFYKILPSEDADKQPRDTQKPSTAAGKEAFFLQAGAFQNPRDADDMKARLALLGIEARIETSTTSDKGILHRVRVGPYTSVEELNRTRDTLKQNDVATTLIRVREPER